MSWDGNLDKLERKIQRERERLTPHQREVFERLVRRSVSRDGERHWIDARDNGSLGALDRLYMKGWVERREELGPRGGLHLSYRPAASRVKSPVT